VEEPAFGNPAIARGAAARKLGERSGDSEIEERRRVMLIVGEGNGIVASDRIDVPDSVTGVRELEIGKPVVRLPGQQVSQGAYGFERVEAPALVSVVNVAARFRKPEAARKGVVRRVAVVRRIGIELGRTRAGVDPIGRTQPAGGIVRVELKRAGEKALR